MKRDVVGHQRAIDASACLNMIFRVVQYLRNKNRHDKIRRYVTLGKKWLKMHGIFSKKQKERELNSWVLSN
ncbi:MAG: hypothetical protein WA220_13390 [Candidatus Nitrosopolaris sp.]